MRTRRAFSVLMSWSFLIAPAASAGSAPPISARPGSGVTAQIFSPLWSRSIPGTPPSRDPAKLHIEAQALQASGRGLALQASLRSAFGKLPLDSLEIKCGGGVCEIVGWLNGLRSDAEGQQVGKAFSDTGLSLADGRHGFKDVTTVLAPRNRPGGAYGFVTYLTLQ